MESKRKVSVFLPTHLFQRFNAYCANQGYKKSPLIARLIRELLDGESMNENGKRDTNRVGQAVRKR